MLAFQVEIDGLPVVVAGAPDWSILTLHVNAARGEPKAKATSARSDNIDFSVGGLSERTTDGEAHHFRWKPQSLGVGSRVVVTVVETETPDPPIKRYRSDSTVQECPFTDEELREMRWQDYLALKKEFQDEVQG